MAGAAGKPDPVSDDELIRLIEGEIKAGISFENDDGEDLSRSDALDYIDGIMRDLKAEKGRSSVVSRDCADAINLVKPGLMRIFAGAARIVEYQPARRGDEKSAEQATDYVNYVWEHECDGYRVLDTAITDALSVRNGIIKTYWDPTPDYETEDLTQLTEDQLAILFDDPDIDKNPLGSRSYKQMLPDPATGQMVEVVLYDLRIRRATSSGRLVIENVAGEDFGVSKGALSIDTARAVWHRPKMSRSDLIKAGYPRDVVADLPAYGASTASTSERRSAERSGLPGSADDKSATGEVEITEAYCFVDRDGDGIAESRKVVLAGAPGALKLLSDEPWSDDRPFEDLRPKNVPHRWMGQSIPDDIADLQRVKTALWRAALDNTYAQNFPDREVVDKFIIDPDEVQSRRFGNRIRVKEPGAFRDVPVPFVAANTLQAIRAIDGVLQMRTGFSQATPSLDSTALDPQTATAEQLEHDAAYASTELIARTMAEGLRRLFAKILRIIVRNQDRPRTIRLRDEWVDFDPRDWNAGMDASVSVGLGTGSRERDLKMLAALYARQVEIIDKFGPDNPVVRPSMAVATLHKMVEASGLRNRESYFADVSDEDFAQWQASRPQQPDPRQAAVEARIAGDRERIQAQIEGNRERALAEAQIRREEAAADLQADRERLEQEYALKAEQMEREFALRRQELDNEMQLRGAAIVTGAQGVSTNLPRQ